ncbi:hypothetical protein BOW52_06095, partial [Solemya elarraichensis gill symbiont]
MGLAENIKVTPEKVSLLPNKPVTQATLRLLDNWIFHPGMGYGLQQSFISGKIIVAMQQEPDFRLIDKLMERFIIEPLPETFTSSDKTELLLHRLVHWITSIQRQQNTPMSYRYHLSSEEKKEGEQQFFLAIPSHIMQSSTNVTEWAITLFNNLLNRPYLDGNDLNQISGSLEHLNATLKQYRLPGQNSIYIYKAAYELDIP